MRTVAEPLWIKTTSRVAARRLRRGKVRRFIEPPAGSTGRLTADFVSNLSVKPTFSR
jgi:hypothetical protein